MAGELKGSKTRLYIYQEAVEGTSPAPGANGLRLPYTSNTLGKKQTQVMSEELTGSRFPQKPYLDEVTVDGDWGIELDSRAGAYLMKHALGGVVTTVDTPTPGINRHVITPGDLPPGLTAEKHFVGSGIVLRQSGVRINRFTADIATGGILRMPFSVMGRDTVLDTVPLDAAPIYYAKSCFRIPAVTFSKGGAAYGNARRFTIEFINNLDPQRYMGDAGLVGGHAEGMVGIRGTLTVAFKSVTELNQALSAAEDALIFTFPATIANHSMQWELQEVTYDVKEPDILSAGTVLLDMGYSAFTDNGAAGVPMICTMFNDLVSIATIAA